MSDTPEVLLNEASYERWLSAQRPQPIAWFLGLSELEQETLAGIGHEHAEAAALNLAYAIADPQAAEAGRDAATDPEAEVALASRLAVGLVEKWAAGRPAVAEPEPAPEAVSMAGIGARRSENHREPERKGGRLFGKVADEIAGTPAIPVTPDREATG